MAMLHNIVYRNHWHWIVVVVIIKENWFVVLLGMSDDSCYCLLVCSALVLDSNAQDRVEPYGIQAVKDIEAFLQIASKSITINPYPYKVQVMYYTIE